MSRTHMIIALGAIVAAPLAAQEAPPQLKSRVQMQSSGEPSWSSSGTNMMITRRARLGIKVNLQARASDSIGAYVDAVTPGGAAAKAGLEAGDILTRLDGTPLVTATMVDGKAAAGPQVVPDRSLPGLRLIELAARLPANDTILVEYRRGKNARTATLVTQEDPDNVFVMTTDGNREFTFNFNGDGPDGFDGPLPGMGMGMRMPMEPGTKMRTPMGNGDMQYRVFLSSDLEDLELVPLNADLAPYFGAADGVLVITVPQGSTLGLKGGDVVLMIDGRKPANTAQMHRILRSYDPGNPVKFEVMRNKKTVTVAGTIPKAPETKWRTMPDSTTKLRTKGSAGT